MAIGVVTDLGSSDTVMASSSPNKRHRSHTLRIEVNEPTVHPTKIGSQFFFRIWIFP